MSTATATQTYGLTGTLAGVTAGFTGTNSLITLGSKVYQGEMIVTAGTYSPLCTISATVAAGALVTLKAGMIINKSSTITARLMITDTAGNEYLVEIAPLGAYFIDTDQLEYIADGSGFVGWSSMDTLSITSASATAVIQYIFIGT